MDVVIVPGRHEHAVALAGTMRPQDVRELEACGQAPLEGVLNAMGLSDMTWSALHDGVVGAMFGVRRLPPTEMVLGARPRGHFWFLTGHLFGEKKMPFARASRRVVDALLQDFSELFNVIDGRYTEALVFAMLMGADFGSPVPIGPGRVPFIPFTIRRA